MRLRYLVRKELIEIFRQKQLVAMMFVMPVVQILVLGHVLTTDIRHIPVEVVNGSSTRAAADLVRRLQITPQFAVKAVRRQPGGEMEKLRRGEVKAVIVLRDGPDRGTRRLPYPEVQILMDGIDSNTSMIAAGYFNGIVRNYLLRDLARRSQAPPIETRPLFRFNPDLRSIRYMGPGLAVMLVTVLSLFLGAMGVVREREQQTLDTLRISPLHPIEIYLGKAVPVVLLAMASLALSIGAVIGIFGVPLQGPIPDLALAILVYQFTMLALGLLISTLASTQQEGMFFAWFCMITFLLLSGFMTPVENTPPALRPLVAVNPMFYMMKVVREVFLKGNGLSFFWKDLLALVAILAVVVTGSLASFRRLVRR